MKFEFHPHTADIRMKVEAPNLKELFEVALLGMGEILREGWCNGHHNLPMKVTINIESKDRTCLLIDFLSEVLSLSYAKKAVYCQLQISTLRTTKLEGCILGAPVNFLDEEIKAVTYHEANLIKNQRNQWETLIIFDI
jgi:SHS2 domain-containing protein